MKSARDHLMFVLPLMVILIGIEFFIVFDRVTQNYEEKLKSSYSILVVARKKIDLPTFKKIDDRIVDAETMKRKDIARIIAKEMRNASGNEILKSLPYFYSIHLNSFLRQDEIDGIEKKLMKYPGINRVETFGDSHNSKYNLFVFLKTLFWSFVLLMSLVSIFLIIKQMEVWHMAHRERMQTMEIFGASMMLRSGVLFRMGIVDALTATMLSSGIFAILKYYWVPNSGIELFMQKRDLIFEPADIAILLGISMTIVIVAVINVAMISREIRE